MKKLLIVDDDPDVLLAARLLLKRHFGQVDIEKNPARLPFLLTNGRYDVLLLDMNFRLDTNSGREGFDWLDRVLDLSPALPVVLFTAYGDVEMAVRAIKAGAADFVLKPWENDKLVATLLAAATTKSPPPTGPGTATAPDAPTLITQNPAMLALLDTVGRVAPTEANVLILGENGTGKDLLAREIHRQSARREGPFVNVDLGALTESLFESELFGHVKGAFTDARDDRAGRFEQAQGGTLFLDEIGNISPAQQARLLSVLQQRTVTRVGSNRPIPLDVRLVCATNADLHGRVEDRRFRADLLYRINTIELRLPPLRDRPDDIPRLADHFLQRYSHQHHRPLTGISPALLARWQQHDWPGNVRELQHTIERAVILFRPPANPADSPADINLLTDTEGASPTRPVSVALSPVQQTMQLEAMEKQLIQQALHQQNGNITEVARTLGLSRQALYRRMEKYGL